MGVDVGAAGDDAAVVGVVAGSSAIAPRTQRPLTMEGIERNYGA